MLACFWFASLAYFDWLCLVEFLGFNLHTRAWLLLGLLTGLLVLLGFLDLRGLRALLALLDLLGLLASLCLPPSRFACALRFLRYLLASHCLPFCSLTSFAWLPKNCLPCLVDWRLVDWRRELARLFLILNNLSFCKPTLPT